MKEIEFTCLDGKKLACFLWDDVKKPKGVIQLIHGLTSHTKRYEDFAEVLNAAGYIVFGDDHRVNGKTAGVENLGKADRNNFNDNVSDEIAITKMLLEKFRLPVGLFAHSYGSFLAQRYMHSPAVWSAVFCSAGRLYGRAEAFGARFSPFQRIFCKTLRPAICLPK